MKFIVNQLFLLFIIVSSVQSQSLSITVTDINKEPLIGATVQLTGLNAAPAAAVTDLDGVARFPNIKPAIFTIIIRYIGYEALEKQITLKAGVNQLSFQLTEDAISLGEVTVTAAKPLIMQEDDKMIIDPEPIANISTNTLEVLEQTPGLFVDQEGGIFLSSTSPAQILINGREQRMSSQDIAALLQSLPPGSVHRIEVMRTPSTKYDAASSGGVINIILKKGVRLGRTGSISVGMNQGFYGDQFAGLNLNESGQKSTYYLNLNYNQNNRLETVNSVRALPEDRFLRQDSRNSRPGQREFIGFGASYDPNDKWSLGYDGRITSRSRNALNYNINAVDIAFINVSETENQVRNDYGGFNLQQDLSAKLKIDTMGSEWETQFSYNYNNRYTDQLYDTYSTQPRQRLQAGEGENRQNRHFFLLQTDLTYRFTEKIRLETGLKSTFQGYRSAADYFIWEQTELVPDIRRTNAFKYEESINSAYLQASVTLPGKLLMKAGARVEHTYMRGNQTIPADTSFVINRADWFPYVYLSRPVISISNVELRAFLIYRRTINRPDYDNLNPYVRIVDEYLYETGNPALTPQFTDNIEANISYNDRPIFAVGQNQTRDIFANVVYQDSQNPEVAVRTQDNVGTNKETYFRVLAAIPPGGKYFFVLGTQYNLNEYQGLYENQPLSFIRGSWRFFTFHSLTLFKQTKLTMNGFMLLNGQQNFYELNTFGQLNFGINQTLLKKKLQINLTARDVLRTMVTGFSLQQGGVTILGERYSDNQRYGINLRYNLGIKKKEERQGLQGMDFSE
jgi:iron complex outermembrane recepter protein